MKFHNISNLQLGDTAADSVINRSAEQAVLESHLGALQDKYRELVQISSVS